MADYLLNRIVMGTIITFRYSNPKTQFGSRDVIVLTTNYLGDLHGLKINMLTPSEQEYLQLIFRSIWTNPKDFFEPLMATLQQKKQELEQISIQQTELLKSQQATIMVPQTQQQFGQPPGLKSMLSSIFSKIKTFGRTPVQPSNYQLVNIQRQIQQNEKMIQAKRADFDAYFQYVQAQKNSWGSMTNVPKDPYRMYHNIIKTLIPRERMPDIYRKYKVALIKTPRIIKSPGVLYERK